MDKILAFIEAAKDLCKIALLLLFLVPLAYCSFGGKNDKAPTPDISSAKNYSLVSTEDSSFPGRIRKSWIAVSTEAATFESRAQTAIRAAIDLQKSSGAQVVQVYLVETPDAKFPLANAWYAVDGKGMSGDQDWKWDVSASRDKPGQCFMETYNVR